MNKDEKIPNILIISHNCFNNKSGMGKTLKSIFSGWKSQNIAQLYFRNEYPSSTNCNNFYRITDKNIFHSIFKNTNKVGTVIEIDKNNIKSINKFEKISYNLGSKRYSSITLARDLMWSLGKWNSKKLNLWISNFNPKVIFFVPGDYIFSYIIALKIAKYNNIPLILYYTDDYFKNRFSINPLYLFKQFIINKIGKKAINQSKKIFTISEKMQYEYKKKFNKNSTVINNNLIIDMKKIKDNKKEIIKNNKKQIILSYIGSLHSNRWKSLQEIGEVLKEINKKEKKAELHIYSCDNIKNKILKKLLIKDTVYFKGKLNEEEVKLVQYNSEILVHVESFSRKYKNLTRLSLSTKIPEYLAQGKCILAYGPKNIASIEYLKKYKAAFICEKYKFLEAEMRKMIDNEKLRNKYAKRALCLAKQKHNYWENNNIFINTVNEIANNKYD